MKRVCTESEKELLLKNKKQMLQGINWTSRNGSWGTKAVVGIVPVFIAVAVMAPFIIKFDLPWLVIVVCLMVIDFISSIILWLVINSQRAKKETKAFLAQKNLSINGATVVEVGGVDRFAYIEDDVHDENGKPIIIDYPSTSYEIEENEVGKRLLIMYAEDGSYQLLKVNDELKGLIPAYSQDYPLGGQIEEYIRVPHPNMLHMEKEEKVLSDVERAEYAKLSVKIIQGAAFGVAKKAYVALFFIIAIMVILLHFVEGGIPLETSLPYAVLGYLGLGAFFVLMSFIGKSNISRQSQYVSMKEVVFHSYTIDNNLAKVTVYEWKDGRPEIMEYFAGNVSAKTKYGTIIYKFLNKKGKEVLLNKELMNKK